MVRSHRRAQTRSTRSTCIPVRAVGRLRCKDKDGPASHGTGRAGPNLDADLGPGRTLRQGREYHSFQRARDALFALMRLAEPKLDRGSSVRKTFTGKVRELFADLLDDSVEPFTHFFVKQLAKWSVPAPLCARCTTTLTSRRAHPSRSSLNAVRTRA